jgi:hypothetical protein
MSNEKDSVISKIRKALAISQDGANDQECETALLMAQRLMAKHGIDMSEVENVEDGKEVVHENITDRGRTPYWKKALAKVIADNFRCYTYNRTGGGKSRIVFLGTKSDVELAKELFEFAVNVLQQSVKKFLAEQKKERGDDYSGTGLRNDYILGFVDGLREKFLEQVKELSLTPALVKDKEVVSAHESMNFRRTSGSRIQRQFDRGAYQSGHSEGRSLSKNTKLT